MDLESTFKFIENNNLNVDIPLRTLVDAIAETKTNKKTLIIYLHNGYHNFSSEIVPYISQDLVESANLVVWDLTDVENPKSLITVSNLQLNCDQLEDCIASSKPAIFIFTYSMELVGFYDSNTSCDLIVSGITDIIDAGEEEMEVDQIGEVDIGMDKRVHEALNEAGIEVLTCLSKAMDVAIAERRPLLIYIHKSTDIFTKTIWPLFFNKDVNDVFKKYTFYAFDTEGSPDNVEFFETAAAHKQLQEIVKHAKLGEGCIHTFSTVKGEIELNGFFRGDTKMEEFLFQIYNIQIVHVEEKQAMYTLIEKTAIVSAVNDIMMQYDFEDLTFTYDTIDETIKKKLLLEPEYLQKMLLIFYYNKDDNFCQDFLNELMSNSELRRVISEMYHIVAIDVRTHAYKTALKSVVKCNFDYEPMEMYINDQKGALFVVTSMANRPELCSFYTDGDIGDNMTIGLYEFSQFYQKQKQITDVVEMRVVNSFIKKHKHLPSYFLKRNVLHEAIQENCLCTPIKKRKMLLLYYDDITNEQCRQFTNETLANDKVLGLLRENCHFVAWDITVSDEQKESLCLAIKRCFALEKMEAMLNKKIPGVFFFMPIGHTLVLYDLMYGGKQFRRSAVLDKLKRGVEFLLAEKSTEEALKKFNNEDGPVQFQQFMYDQLGNRDYDCFDLKKEGQSDLLKRKIQIGLYGPPSQEESEMDAKVKKKQFEKVNELYAKMLEQVKNYAESNDLVVMTCVFNCINPLPKTKLERLKKEADYNPSLDFMPLPVFVLRKCVNCPADRTPCRIYIDHDMRTYQSWDAYLEGNKLPKGMFIVPKDGKYQGDHFGNVRVEFKLSPACNLGNDILKVVDIGTAVAGLASGAVGLVALIPAVTLAPPIAIGAIGVGIGVGVVSLLRSSMTLHDRFCHDESMSFSNSQARSAYFNIVASSFSFTGLGATYMLTYFVKNGASVGLVVKSTVTGLNGINLVTSGMAVANSAFDVLYNYISEDEKPNALAVLQLSSSILFFGHAVYSFKTANTIIDEVQYKSLKEIEVTLRSNRHRKMFTKMKLETIRVNGDVQQGQAEVISYMKELNNHDEVLATLTRTNKDLNKAGIRFSVKDGQLNFNGKFVEIGDFSNMSKLQRSEYMLTLPPKQDSKCMQINLVSDIITTKFTTINIANIIMNGMSIYNKVQCLSDLTNIFSFYVQDKIYSLLKRLLECLFANADLSRNLLSIFSLDKIPVQVLHLIIAFFKEKVMENEKKCIEEGADEAMLRKRKNITRAVYYLEKAVIISAVSVESTLKELIDYSYKWISQKIYVFASELCHAEDAHNSSKSPICCPVCEGNYYK